MKRNALLLASGLWASSLIAAAADHTAHWDYQSHGGAAHWGDLDPGFAQCKLGKEQSPIDIRGAKKAKLDPIEVAYGKSSAEVVNNGHTIQVNLSAGGTAKLVGGKYKLVQFHFHTPSEEKIDGAAFPLVAHLVHKDDAGNLAVVAVLFKQGKENAALKPIFDAMPEKAGETKPLAAAFDAADLLPADKGYFAYSGSLTTPPCSEGVRWHVLKHTVELSAEQLQSFEKLYSMNARPVQPIHGRKIEVSE